MRITLRLFSVERFGFYQYSGKEGCYEDVNKILNEMQLWAKSDNRETINTTTFEIKPTSKLPQSYFYDSKIEGCNALVILWHEQKNRKGKTIALEGGGKPGESAVVTSEFNGKISNPIPGVPGYYMLFSDIGVLACIDIEHASLSSKITLEKYLKGFMCTRWPYKEYEDKTDDDGEVKEITKYAFSKGSDFKLVYPRVDFNLARSKTIVEDLVSNFEKITNIVREDIITTTHNDTRGWTKIFDKLDNDPPAFDTKRKYKQQLQFKPTKMQLLKMIENYYRGVQNGKFDDDEKVGFIIDSKKVMLSGVLANFEVNIAVKPNANGVIDAKQLFDALVKIKDQVVDKKSDFLSDLKFIEEMVEDIAEPEFS